MRVIGTAGHVDHGKSSLVEALTGVHPDRLKEEQAREMTIELGFAYLTLPNGEDIGIVDVPGHRDFIENMLAGVGGIDAALFVVAADEGVMPQTKEHLAILDLLQIPGGVVALTKIDLVEDRAEDRGFIDLVEEDLKRTLAGTVLEQAEIVRVSARKRLGLENLQAALVRCLAQCPPKPDLGRPRLPIDRVFTMAGFGTVVTGTLQDGSLHQDDEIEILPSGLRSRVRSIQTHRHKVDQSSPGSRTAVNIPGIGLNQVKRGDVLATPNSYTPTTRLDLKFRLLKDASQPLQHQSEVKFFIGASEVFGHVRLIGSEILKPGAEGWLQVELDQPVVAVRGDRYILRRPSPAETLGGGMILDAQPKGRHRRFDAQVLARFEALAAGSPSEMLWQHLLTQGVLSARDLFRAVRMDEKTASQALSQLIEDGRAILLGRGDTSGAETGGIIQPARLVTTRPVWDASERLLKQVLSTYHASFPLRRGMPKEELKGRTKLTAAIFQAVVDALIQRSEIVELGAIIHLKDHMVRFSEQQEAARRKLLARFASAPFSPPSVKECQAEIGEEMYHALLSLDELVPVAPDVVFRREDYLGMRKQVVEFIQKQGSITVAQARDLFDTSRKYALALLEHFDAIGLTLREGDFRRLRKPASRPDLS